MAIAYLDEAENHLATLKLNVSRAKKELQVRLNLLSFRRKKVSALEGSPVFEFPPSSPPLSVQDVSASGKYEAAEASLSLAAGGFAQAQTQRTKAVALPGTRLLCRFFAA